MLHKSNKESVHIVQLYVFKTSTLTQLQTPENKGRKWREEGHEVKQDTEQTEFWGWCLGMGAAGLMRVVSLVLLPEAGLYHPAENTRKPQ